MVHSQLIVKRKYSINEDSLAISRSRMIIYAFNLYHRSYRRKEMWQGGFFPCHTDYIYYFFVLPATTLENSETPSALNA
jgi:hypothetical protein